MLAGHTSGLTASVIAASSPGTKVCAGSVYGT